MYAPFRHTCFASWTGIVVLTGQYLEDGEFGAGWYGDEIALNEWYENGCFEICCICSEGDAFWSAFWLQAEQSMIFLSVLMKIASPQQSTMQVLV